MERQIPYRAGSRHGSALGQHGTELGTDGVMLGAARIVKSEGAIW